MPHKNLAIYRKKRDFGRTKEPSGEIKVAPSPRRRFVIQKHDATRLHYDLRLEFDGVFKSWAVTRGPSLDPADKRLAVEVEDHPLDYGDFEGTIPDDQYGGGTVQLWDRGYWESDDPDKGFKKGDLKFTLHGQKLHGGFVLVRMKHDRNGGKRTNWLLIKHRDEHVREGKANKVLDDDSSVASGRAMQAIAEGKGRGPKPFMLARSQRTGADAVWDSSQGLAAKQRASGAKEPASKKVLRRKASPGTPAAMPDFIAPQLCRIVEQPPSGDGWAHEIKFDGYRMQLRIEDGEARLRTRTGLDWTDTFPAIAAAAGSYPDGLIDGEVVALNAEGAPDFAALQAALSDEKTDRLIFFAFDLLFAGGEDLRRLPLSERKDRLKALLGRKAKGSHLIRYVEHFTAGGESMMASARELSLEGIISKQLSAPYRSGRSDTWTKAKVRAGHEVVIGGWKTTAGRFKSLMVGVQRDGHLAYVGLAVTLLAPTVPMMFMGEEWGATTPFPFFCDFEGDLAQAIRNGRRKEFAAAYATHGDEVFDPLLPQTYRAATLDWTERSKGPHAERLRLVTELLAIRHREIVPRLAHARFGDAQIGPSGLLTAHWALKDRATLSLSANLTDTPIADAAIDRAGRSIWGGDATGAMPAWHVNWRLGASA